MGAAMRAAGAVAVALNRVGLRRVNQIGARILAGKRVSTTWHELRFAASIDSYTLIMQLEHNTFEPYSTSLFRDTVEQGMHVVDVGANIGIYTVTAAQAGASVTAFEPDPRNRSETREFHARRPAGHSGLYADMEQYLSTFTVETIRLDQVIDRKVDVIKIDAEGAELEVLAGSGKVLDGCRMLIEFAPFALEAAGRTGDELLAELNERFETVLLVDENAAKLVPFRQVRRGNLWCF